ncbi:MAG: Zinc finger, CCHC domain-containing protein, partial [Paramarteilia canceri]
MQHNNCPGFKNAVKRPKLDKFEGDNFFDLKSQEVEISTGTVKEYDFKSDKVKKFIDSKLKSQKKSPENFRNNFLTQFQTLIGQKLRKDAKVFFFGSSYTGLNLKQSDLDLIVNIPSLNRKNNSKKASAYLQQLFYILKDHRRLLKDYELANFSIRLRAAVPVMKFDIKPARNSSLPKTNNSLSVDININSTEGLVNSHLIYVLTQIEPKFKYLVLLMKIWSHKMQINDAPTQKLSSYTLTLLLIFYLQ